MEEKSEFYQRLVKLSKVKNKSINQIERELGYLRNSVHNYKKSERFQGRV